MEWISRQWRDSGLDDQAFWRRATFWLTTAAIVLPFGWLLYFVVRLQPVCVRYFRRDS